MGRIGGGKGRHVADAPQGRPSRQRAPSEADRPIRHSDRGCQYRSFRHTGRLAEAGIDTSVCSVGHSDDDGLAESIIGLFRTGFIKFPGPWKWVGQDEGETLTWVDWSGSARLHSAIGDTTPTKAEEVLYASLNAAEPAA